MICHRCLRLSSRQTLRTFSTSTIHPVQPISPDKAASSNPSPNTPPPATSTAAAQPFSIPNQPSPSSPLTNIPTKPSDPLAGPATKQKKDRQAKQKAEPAVRSNVPAGTALKGLNYFKGKEDPVALEDHEYPPWLWTILTPKASTSGAGQEETDPRLYSKSAKARQIANKRIRAKEAANPDKGVKKVPVYEQSVDLASQGEEGERERQGLQGAMREKRRGDIKTGNFLRGMR